jgi:hypothetical protein
MAIDKLKIFPERDPTDPIKTGRMDRSRWRSIHDLLDHQEPVVDGQRRRQ